MGGWDILKQTNTNCYNYQLHCIVFLTCWALNASFFFFLVFFLLILLFSSFLFYGGQTDRSEFLWAIRMVPCANFGNRSCQMTDGHGRYYTSIYKESKKSIHSKQREYNNWTECKQYLIPTELMRKWQKGILQNGSDRALEKPSICDIWVWAITAGKYRTFCY